MVTEPITIKIRPDSKIGRALDDANGHPVFLERGGTRYRVTRDPEDPWTNYDPEKARAALRNIVGFLTPEEGERMKEMIYRAREEGTRPLDRP